jgi:hypothetical protein
MSSEMSNFIPEIVISEQITRQIGNLAQELAMKAVEECARLYEFDASDAIRRLGLSSVRVERKMSAKMSSKKPREVVVKPSFPLPYNGECDVSCCQALRQNNGLYTQCQSTRKGESEFCKSCLVLASKSSDGIPEYGTIAQRQQVGIFEYVDPKGRKPVAYSKVMKKYKVSQEQVLLEAGKFNITIDPLHFESPEESKRGRPKTAEKAPKEPKGAKGRPKKMKKVLAVEGEEEDLFASLVANAQTPVYESDNESDNESNKAEELAKAAKKEQERVAKEQAKAAKEQERLAKEQEKAAKEAAKEQERLAKEQEKAAKEAAKEQERLAKEQAKAAKEQEKAAKDAAKAAKEQEKAAKEQEKAAKAAEKSTKSVAKKQVEEPEDDGEPDVVKKIEFEGKKYLKSKKTGIIYDYNEYITNQEQVVVGKWNENTNRIVFTKVESDSDSEEEEDEYDEEEEEAQAYARVAGLHD